VERFWFHALSYSIFEFMRDLADKQKIGFRIVPDLAEVYGFAFFKPSV